MSSCSRGVGAGFREVTGVGIVACTCYGTSHVRRPSIARAWLLAKKLSEVQGHIMRAGEVVDGLTTQVAPRVWNALEPAEQACFTEVPREAAARASEEIQRRELELIAELRDRGLVIHEMDRVCCAGCSSARAWAGARGNGGAGRAKPGKMCHNSAVQP